MVRLAKGPSACCFVVCAVVVALAHDARGAVDVPTWEFSDQWEIRETFTIDLSDDDSALSLDVQLISSFRRIGVETRTGSAGGPQRVYVQEHLSGTVDADGSAEIGGTTVDLSFANGDLGGESWSRVSDLAWVHEDLVIEGDLVADFGLIFRGKVARVTLELTMDFVPPAEFYDFPIGEPGETWEVDVMLVLTGRLVVAFAPDIPFDLGDVDQPLDTMVPVQVTMTLGERESRGISRDAYRIDGGEVFTAWYAPEVRNAVEIQTNVFRFDGGGGLEEFTRVVLDAELRPNVGISDLQITPQPAQFGAPVVVTGQTTATTSVEARLDATGSLQTVESNGEGAFTIELTAPDHDDDTPASDDDGSHGIEVFVPAGELRLFKTLQLERPENAARDHWTLY